MDKAIQYIVKWLVLQGMIQESERIIYETGVCQLFIFLWNLLSTLVLGILFHAVKEALLISILFMFLQKYAGSYHAPTRVLCYLGSMVMIAGNIFFSKRIYIQVQVQLVLMLTLLIIVSVMAPVESRNKRLDKKEIMVYGTRTRKICLLYALLWCISVLFREVHFAKIILFVLIDISLLQFLGKVDLYFFDRQYKIYNK